MFNYITYSRTAVFHFTQGDLARCTPQAIWLFQPFTASKTSAFPKSTETFCVVQRRRLSGFQRSTAVRPVKRKPETRVCLTCVGARVTWHRYVFFLKY